MTFSYKYTSIIFTHAHLPILNETERFICIIEQHCKFFKIKYDYSTSNFPPSNTSHVIVGPSLQFMTSRLFFSVTDIYIPKYINFINI